MKGIAARAGVTTGAVTHYFNDKDEVILAALLFVDAAMRSRLDVALERVEGGYHECVCEGVRAGDLYVFRLDDSAVALPYEGSAAMAVDVNK